MDLVNHGHMTTQRLYKAGGCGWLLTPRKLPFQPILPFVEAFCIKQSSLKQWSPTRQKFKNTSATSLWPSLLQMRLAMSSSPIRITLEACSSGHTEMATCHCITSKCLSPIPRSSGWCATAMALEQEVSYSFSFCQLFGMGTFIGEKKKTSDRFAERAKCLLWWAIFGVCLL